MGSKPTAADRAAIRSGVRPIVQRAAAARAHLVDSIERFGGISREEAEIVATAYLRHKLAKLDSIIGRSMVKHGALLEQDTIHGCLAAELARMDGCA